jgi:hypothetical protein
MEGLIQLLQSLSGQASKLAKRLAAYNKLLTDPVNNAHERGRMLAEIQRLAQALPEGDIRQKLDEWLRDELATVEQSCGEFKFEFGRQLVAGLEGSGLTVRGQLPLLRVGLFAVRVDFDAGSATVFWGPEIERVKTGLALVPAELAQTLRSYNERLKQKAVEPDKLARLLHNAYRRTSVLNNLAEGARVFLVRNSHPAPARGVPRQPGTGQVRRVPAHPFQLRPVSAETVRPLRGRGRAHEAARGQLRRDDREVPGALGAGQ